MAMVLIRAAAVWFAAEDPLPAHDHGDHGHEHAHCDHDHNHDHGHSHRHEGVTAAPSGSSLVGAPTAATAPATHGHDHGHDHGWAPWRYMVLAIPVFLYFLDLPRPGFSDVSLDRQRYKGDLVNPQREALSMFVGGPALTKVLKKDEPRVLQLGFKELSEAAAMPVRHDAYEGDIGVIRGEFAPIPNSDHEFTLVRWNMTCCRADAIALETRIVTPDPVQINGRPWVKVTGLISFEKTDRGKWIPVLTVRSNADIVETEPTQDANAF
jgi:hypothetical protein